MVILRIVPLARVPSSLHNNGSCNSIVRASFGQLLVPHDTNGLGTSQGNFRNRALSWDFLAMYSDAARHSG
eukprot:6084550-Pyramimonas_sp.AAC.1